MIQNLNLNWGEKKSNLLKIRKINLADKLVFLQYKILNAKLKLYKT